MNEEPDTQPESRRALLLDSANWFAAALALVIGLSMTPVIYWIIADDSVPVAVYSIKVENDPVTPGEDLLMVFRGERFRICATYVSEEILHSGTLVQPIKERLGRVDSKQGPFTVNIAVATPPAALPGPGEYRSTVRYECNPIQHFFPIIVERRVGFTFAG